MATKVNPKYDWSKGDGFGNLLYVKGKKIFLKLSSEIRPREIATFSDSQKLIYMIRQPEHLHRKSNSYGFNHELIKTSVSSTHILLTCPEGVFKIPLKFIEDNGNYLFFKQQGFEKQLFLPVELLADFKVETDTFFLSV